MKKKIIQMKKSIKKNDLTLDQERFISKMKFAAELRYEKLKMYGKCYDSFGVMGISMRLKDKISRLINFYEARMNNKDIEESFLRSNETVVDTFMDIINYSIMGLMILDDDYEKLKSKKKEIMLPFKKLWK